MTAFTLTLTIFLTLTNGFGLPRLMLAVVAMRGMSTSATAISTTTIRAITIMFGWCVDDSVFPFCLWVSTEFWHWLCSELTKVDTSADCLINVGLFYAW